MSKTEQEDLYVLTWKELQDLLLSMTKQNTTKQYVWCDARLCKFGYNHNKL